ncbi:MAG: tetratricopeptide repeat protein [Candidatus Aquilonibacter sp.]
MRSSSRAPRAIAGALVLFVALLLALVQLASDAVYANAAPAALVAHLPLAFGVRVYQAIDAVAPAPFVNEALAFAALRQGDPLVAQGYALRVPPGPRRDDLLAQVAAAQGQTALARAYYFAADDVAATQAAIAQLARTDLPAAMQLEDRLRERLLLLGRHPDAVADSYYNSANYEVWLHHYLAGYALDERALALAPLNMGYLLSAANNAFLGGDIADAQRLFERGIAIDPGSGNSYVGLGWIALREGHRDRARAYLQQARAMDPHAQMIPAFEAALK